MRERERENHENWLSSILCSVFLMLPVRVSMYLLLWFRNPGHWWTFISSCYYFITSSSPPLSSPLQLSFPQASFKDIKQLHERGDFVGPNACIDSQTELVFLSPIDVYCSQSVSQSDSWGKGRKENQKLFSRLMTFFVYLICFWVSFCLELQRGKQTLSSALTSIYENLQRKLQKMQSKLPTEHPLG